MKIFALADLHLSLSQHKPMDIFGPVWVEHHLRIAENWQQLAGPQDWILVCGDISWAMDLSGAAKDLEFIARLPGNKVLIRGNHDYWWKSISQVRERLPQGIVAIQNDFVAVNGLAVCGTRGWTVPGESESQMAEDDQKIYRRELIRAEMSLTKAEKAGYKEKIFMLHFPPFMNGILDGGFRSLFADFGVRVCVYGHMHGSDHRFAVEGMIDGVRYIFVAADYTDFTPVEILEL